MTRPDERGFTLIELMVVVLVIAILLAVGIPTMLRARTRSQEGAARANLGVALRSAATIGYDTATAAALTAAEGSVTFVDGATASTGPRIVSVAAGGSSWAAAVMSASGVCITVSTDGSDPVWGTTASTCTGLTAAGLAPAPTTTTAPPSSAPTSTTVAPATPYSALVLASPGLVGFWPLDDTSGTTVLDAGPAHLNGTYTGSVVLGSPGPSRAGTGTSVRFTGGWAELPPIAATLSSGLTISAWVRPETTGFYDRVLELGNGQANDDVWLGRIINDDAVAFEVRPQGTNLDAVAAPSGSLVNGTWQHVAATQSADGTVRIYRNGSLVVTQAYARRPANVLRTVNRIAYGSWTAELPFTGSIDGVAVWSRALSDSEIAQLAGA